MAFENFNPGELRKQIVIMRRTEGTKDEDGFEVDGSGGEEAVRTCKAKVSDESGTKALENGTDFSVTKRRFLIRATPTVITTDMWIRFAGKDYAIVRPPSDFGASGKFLEIWTELREMV